MTDTTRQTGKKSPLDILEDVLEDAKNTNESKKDQAKAAKEKRQQEELTLLKEQKSVVEDKLIQEQLTKMREVSQMAAEKNRQAQNKAEETESEKQKSSQEGYAIQQLSRTKV